nr:DUF4434 domain-containing protein [Vibrio marinisediminis]
MNARGIFYQPLNRDSQVSTSEWQQLMKQTADITGAEDIVVQWNQYGDATFGGQNGWFTNSLEIFQQAGFGIWLGLYSDPDYFKSVHAPANIQNQYLSRYFAELFENYQVWTSWIGNNQDYIRGVYIPAELSDYDFDTITKREVLNSHLARLQKTITESMMISVYFSGKMSPEQTHQWINSIEDLGIKVMVQDGRGTQLLDNSMWQKYAQALPCKVAVIREIFIVEKGEPFSAQKMNKSDFYSIFEQSNCHDNYLFSLRYLPFEQNPLRLVD